MSATGECYRAATVVAKQKWAARGRLLFLRIVVLPKLRGGLVGQVGLLVFDEAEAFELGEGAEELDVFRVRRW